MFAVLYNPFVDAPSGGNARIHGASDKEARRLARIKMGHETQVMEKLRDQRGLPWLEDLLRDLRHGVRCSTKHIHPRTDPHLAESFGNH
jgi:hypothetical protein